jgi:putative peptidoglycan lipid II flippase
MDDFKRSLSLGVRSVIFITLPSAVGLIVLRVPLIQTVFQRGAFTYQDTLVTAQALLFFSLGLVGYSVQQVLNRVFYAIHDSRTPVVAGSAAIFFNILLSFLLVKPMGHKGLALAYSVTGILSMLLLLVMLRPRLGRIGGKRMLSSFTLTLMASAVMGVAVSLVVSWLPHMLHFTGTVNQLIVLLVGVAVGCLVFGGISLFLRMEEAEMIVNLFLRRRSA